jgi:hypothetical protein
MAGVLLTNGLNQPPPPISFRVKLVQKSRKQVLRAYCPNTYTVNERGSKGHILLTFVSEQWAMNQPKNLTKLHFDRI